MIGPQHTGGSLDADAVKERAGEAGCLAVLRALGVDTDAGRRRGDNLDGLRLPPALGSDTNASFSVHLTEWLCKDFGGHFDGTLFQLVEEARGCSFPEAVGWVADVCGLVGRLNGQRAPVQPASPPVRTPEPPAASEPTFWTRERRRLLRAAQDRLTPDHPLARMAEERDGLTVETLRAFGCGVWSEHGREWLAFPYPSGAQLYRREGGEKRLLSVSGSKPSASFFGTTRLKGDGAAAHLVIAKSPREAMLVAQACPEAAAVGLPGGEKKELSNVQARFLRGLASVLPNVRRVSVSLDCDTPEAERTARSFAASVAAAFGADAPAVGLVNVHASTDGEDKDLADVARAGGGIGTILPELLADAEPVEPAADTQQDVSTETAEASGPRSQPGAVPPAGPPIPAAVYAALPEDLRAACLLLREGHERDVFLTGLLPCISAALPHVLTRYSRRWKALPLMAAVVAPAGSGKGTLQLAAETVASIDDRLRAASDSELADWQALDTKERKGEERPAYRRLRLAADSSLRAITDGLLAGGGRGLIFETEIRVLASSLKQDWGDFKGLLLKAAEQEAYERARKDEPPVFIRRPELPASLSGTPGSFTDWMQDAEDGLFSRFLFYAFTAPPVWISQFENETDDALDGVLTRIGARLDAMHRALSARPPDDEGQPTPLYLRLEPAQQRDVNEAFAALQTHLHAWRRPELLASVKRGAFQAVRIAGVLGAYRLASSGADLSRLKSYTPTSAEVSAAVELVRCYLQHAAALAVSFAHDPAAQLESEEHRRLFERLPEAFTTAEALELGEALGMPSRNVERALKAMVERHGLLRKEKRGHYAKDLPPLPAPMAEAAEAAATGGPAPSLPPLPPEPTLPPLPPEPPHSGDGAAGLFEPSPGDPWEPWAGEDETGLSL